MRIVVNKQKCPQNHRCPSIAVCPKGAITQDNHFSLPVVDAENRLVGIVTVDDAVDVIQEEATEDFEKMAAIAKKRQILCITHLPQIAAMADNHFLIEKSVEGNKTITNIICLDNYGSVNEISRLMGGDNGGIVEKAAAKMKEDAQSFKKSLK